MPTRWRIRGGRGDRAIKCRLQVPQTSLHTYQVIAGLIMLAREGVIDLEVTLLPSSKDGRSGHTLNLLVDDRKLLTYDMYDGYNFDRASFESSVAGCDLYFKRSFDPDLNVGVTGAERIHPYGFNYPVVTPHSIFRRLELARIGRSPRDVAGWALGRGVMKVTDFESVPRPPLGDPHVVFLTQAWNPREALTDADSDDRAALNRFRAGCIEALQAQLGPQVLAGFTASSYALATYPASMLVRELRHPRFISVLKRCDIGVVTRGLFGSNGWTLAECLAAAKGVVAETPRYRTTGSFTAGINYLDFKSPDGCVERTVELLHDPERLARMKVANHAYYQSNVRPDQIVRNTLRTALDTP